MRISWSAGRGCRGLSPGWTGNIHFKLNVMRKLILTVAFLIAGVCLSAETDFGYDKIYDAVTIRFAIDSIAREHGVPSVAFAVVNRDSIIVADAVGFANVEKGIPATPETARRCQACARG